jgi:hypothetical protein
LATTTSKKISSTTLLLLIIRILPIILDALQESGNANLFVRYDESPYRLSVGFAKRYDEVIKSVSTTKNVAR